MDNEIKKKEVLQTLNKNDCLVKINYQYPNHHRNIRAKTQTRSDARLAEFRIEEPLSFVSSTVNQATF